MSHDCTWPLPYAFPRSKAGPEWAFLKAQAKGTDGQDSPAAIEALDKVLGLRKAITDFFADKNPSAKPQLSFVEGTCRPYVQLVAQATQRLDFSLADKKLSKAKIAWDDAWTGKERTVEGNPICDAAFVAYSMGAALTVAGSQSVALATVDGYKAGFQAFQQAAGVFAVLASEGSARLRPAPGALIAMFTPEVLTFCQTVALANASHCFVLRAEVEMEGKKAMLAKLCIDAATAYDAVPRCLVPLSREDCPPYNSLIAHAATAAAMLRARAHKYLGQQYFADQEAGLAIAHLAQAKTFASSQWQPSNAKPDKNTAVLMAWWNYELPSIEDALAKAHQRNETIYFAKVPSPCPAIEGFGKPKGSPVSYAGLHALDAAQANPFADIVPRKVAEAAARFKSAMFDQLAAATRQALTNREWTTEALASIGVSGTIQCLSDDPSLACHIPAALKSKVLALRGSSDDGRSPGDLLQRLVTLVSHTHQVAESSNGLLREAAEYLAAEKAEDEGHAKNYGDRVWRPLRATSSELPEVARIHKCSKDLQQQIASTVLHPLQQLKAKLEANAQGLSRLDWPIADLDALMPYTGSDEVQGAKADVQGCVTQLQGIMTRIDQSINVETTRLKEIQAFIASPRPVLALIGQDPARFDAILEEIQAELIDHYSVVNAAIESRKTLVEEAQTVMLEVAAKRSADPVSLEIQEVCTTIERNISMFESARAEINALANNAGLLLDEASLLRNAARDLCHARSLEAQDFSDNLDKEINARMANIQASQQMQVDDSISESRRRQADLMAQIQALETQRNSAAPVAPVAAAQYGVGVPMGAAPVVSYDYPGYATQAVAPYPMYGLPSDPPTQLPLQTAGYTGAAAAPPPPPPPPPSAPPRQQSGDDAFAQFFR